MSASLPDILEGDLDIVFVGTNPGLYSAEQGHYYARTANRFWPMLYQSGLLPCALRPEDDWKLLRFRMGLTDLVSRATPGTQELSPAEMKAGGPLLEQKLRFYRPRMVCLNGLLVYRSLFKRQGGPGLKPERLASAKVFVVPSTSPRNASYRDAVLLDWFQKLSTLKKQLPHAP